jgi:hypothetical protein
MSMRRLLPRPLGPSWPAGAAIPQSLIALAQRDRARPILLWWSALAVMLLALLAPILAVPIPPLIDYPNHLARCFFLAFGAPDPVLSRIFVAHWAIIPNLAMDLILPPLMHIMPPLVAGRVVVALAVILPTTGAIALSRASFGRLSLWSLGVGFVAYNTLFLIGALNFQLAAGVALWGAACWVALRPHHPIAAVLTGIGFAVGAFFAHLFGFAFYAVLIGCAELASITQRGLGNAAAWRFALKRAGAVLAVASIPIALYLSAPFAAAGGAIRWAGPAKQFLMLLVPVLAYSRLAALALLLCLAIPVLIWARRGFLQVAPMARIALPLLSVAYLVLPLGAKGGFWVDTRIPVLLGFMLFALIRPVHLSRRHATCAVAAFAVLFAVRMAYITVVWRNAAHDVTAVRQVLTEVTPGSRVLVIDGNAHLTDGGHRDGGHDDEIAHNFGNAYWHYGAFALIDRRAFWSDAFALPGQQPVALLPPYDAAGDHGLQPPRGLRTLVAGASAAPSSNPLDYVSGWPAKFDYVLLLDADQVPNLLALVPSHLALLSHVGMAALFRVR